MDLCQAALNFSFKEYVKSSTYLISHEYVSTLKQKALQERETQQT